MPLLTSTGFVRSWTKIAILLLLTTSIITTPIFGQTFNSTGTRRTSTTRGPVSEIRLDGFRAESFPAATRLTWRTTYEKNIVGYRVWRDDGGARVQVDDQFVAGSLMQIGGGELRAGSDYELLDDVTLTGAPYWLEAIDIQQKSRWYGPFYPQPNYDYFANEKVAESAAPERAARREALTEWVEFAGNDDSAKSAGNQEAFLSNGESLTTNGNAVKIEVRDRGVYRVPYATLAANGFDIASSASWRLFRGGVEQNMIVNSDGSVEFFGFGVDSLYEDTAVYWLAPDSASGRRMTRTTQGFVKNAQYGWSLVTTERRERLSYVSSILNGDRENWFGAVVSATAANQNLTLNEIARTSGTTATLSVDIQGLTTATHAITVAVNGTTVGSFSFSSVTRRAWSVSVPLSLLVEGTNTVTVRATAGPQDINILEAVRMTYPRQNRARGDRLEFTIPGNNQVNLIRGFTTQNVRVFDISNPASVNEIAASVRLDTDGRFMVSVPGAASERRLLAVGASNGVAAPPAVYRNEASNLRATENAAKMIIVAPRDFVPLVTPLATRRTNEGLRTVVVDVEDIYDEFSDGQRSPQAIKNFFQHAYYNWSIRPEFAIIAADASIDPKNYGNARAAIARNRIPAILVDTWNMETTSDEMLVDFTWDGVGEIALGRLPGSTTAEMQAILDKIMTSAPMTAAEYNLRGAHFVSDGPIGYDFANGSRTISTFFPTTSTPEFIDAGGQDPVIVRSDIVGRINKGPAVVNYFGHGSVTIWSSSQYLRTSDAPSFYSPGRTPFVGMINCLNGYYAGPTGSLAEAALKQPNGGATAVWASTGWNSAYDQEFYARDFYQRVFTGMPMGEAARRTKMFYASIDLRNTYVFFGDPSQPLVQ